MYISLYISEHRHSVCMLLRTQNRATRIGWQHRGLQQLEMQQVGLQQLDPQLDPQQEGWEQLEMQQVG